MNQGEGGGGGGTDRITVGKRKLYFVPAVPKISQFVVYMAICLFVDTLEESLQVSHVVECNDS